MREKDGDAVGRGEFQQLFERRRRRRRVWLIDGPAAWRTAMAARNAWIGELESEAQGVTLLLSRSGQLGRRITQSFGQPITNWRT